MVRHTISLPEPMSHYIEGRIAEGQYGNVSEYFRDLVRRDQERRQIAMEELRALIDRAEASGISEKTVEDIWKEAKARHVNRHGD
jgi:antitoxin ParD1/3/4